MNSRELIRHPGEESIPRRVSAFGHIKTHTVTLPAGSLLLPAVTRVMESIGADCGVLVLENARIGPFNYVMPAQSTDGLHAAWYSHTHSCNDARIRNATAIVGKREDQCWLHCHALWDVESPAASSTDKNAQETKDPIYGMGHLLPDEVTLAEDIVTTLYEFTGGCFDVELDPETAFSVFHLSGGMQTGTAFIAKVNPHEDIHNSITQLILEAGYTSASVVGIGSLIGTSFENDPPMLCPISEVLIQPGATWSNRTLSLPMYCVDIDGHFYAGNVINDGAPVLVTFELLVMET